MAHDLIFGKTSRDWSCGALVQRFPTSSPVQADLDVAIETSASSVESLFQEVRKAIQQNFDSAVRLTRAKRLPGAEWKSFSQFMNKWLAFGLSKNGTFGPDDIDSLAAFREANKRFTERLAVYLNIANTPLKKPIQLPLPAPVALAPTAPPPDKSGGGSWGWLLGLGLGLAGLGFIVGKHP